MILLSTKFNVVKDFTPEVLFQLLCNWLNDSAHYDIPIDYHDESDYESSSEDGNQILKIYKTDDKFGVQVAISDENTTHTNTYILSQSDKGNVVFVELSREYLKSTTRCNTMLKIPQLMRQIFWEEYGDMDNDILTDDKSLIIRKHNIDIAKHIILNEKQYMNPIVYVSPYIATGKYATNYERLASDLLGVAHVVVEGNPNISFMVRDMTDGENPYDGAVAVLMPTGERHTFVPKSDDLTRSIINYVRDATASVAPGEEFSFQKIRYNCLLKKATELSGGNAELEELYDAVLSEKDQELKAANEKIDKLKLDVHNQKAHIDSLNEALNQAKTENKVGIVLATAEDDLYVGEMRDVILKILEKEYKALNTDKKAKTSRKVTLLADILEKNARTGKDTEITKAFKQHFKEGTCNTESMSEIEKLGFSLSKDGNKHYKILFNNDARYQMSVSSTPSDRRAGENLTTSYMNMLFGY